MGSTESLSIVIVHFFFMAENFHFLAFSIEVDSTQLTNEATNQSQNTLCTCRYLIWILQAHQVQNGSQSEFPETNPDSVSQSSRW